VIPAMTVCQVDLHAACGTGVLMDASVTGSPSASCVRAPSDRAF